MLRTGTDVTHHFAVDFGYTTHKGRGIDLRVTPAVQHCKSRIDT